MKLKAAAPKLSTKKPINAVIPAKVKAAPLVERSKGDPSQDYRGQRKHTVSFIEGYLADPAALRARIKGVKLVKVGDITTAELMTFLRTIESDPRKSQLRGQPGPDGKPRKPGRPKKEEAVAAAPAKVNAKATLASAAKGAVLAAKKAPAAPAKKLVVKKK